MGSCNSGNLIAGNNIYTDITICYEPQQKYHIGMVSNQVRGGGEGKRGRAEK